MTTPSYYTVIYFLHPKNKLYLDSKGIEGFSVLNTVFFLNSEELQYTCTIYLQSTSTLQSMAAATPSLQGYIFHLPEALLISELIL